MQFSPLTRTPEPLVPLDKKKFASRVQNRDVKHAHHVLSKMSSQTLNFLKKFKKLDDELLFDSPASTAVEAERDMLMRSIEDNLKTINNTNGFLHDCKKRESVAMARYNELSTIMNVTGSEQKVHDGRIASVQENIDKFMKLKEVESDARAQLRQYMAQLDKQRNEDGKRLLQLEHVLDNRNRELARIDIILVTHQKDLTNDMDFYSTSCSTKFNTGRELRRVRMLEIMNVLDQRLYFIERKANTFLNDDERVQKIFVDKNISTSHIAAIDQFLSVDRNEHDGEKNHSLQLKNEINSLRESFRSMARSFPRNTLPKLRNALGKSRLINSSPSESPNLIFPHSPIPFTPAIPLFTSKSIKKDNLVVDIAYDDDFIREESNYTSVMGVSRK